MMMPILEQSPVHHHHHHNYAHQTFYHPQQQSPQQIPEPTGKIQLTLILPSGVPSVISVDANTPMMDLLVQAASLNKLNPSGYSLVVLDSNQHVIHFKANQTVGQIVKNCHLPQINGSSTISLLPKEPTHSTPSPKSKTQQQPFEITVRLQVNLPDAQKILLRVDPTLPLHEIKEQICKQKKYIHSNEYTLRLPNKLDQPLALGLSLAEYKTNELTLIHDKNYDYDYQSNTNQLQSFDRLYRARSESQPAKEILHDIQNDQQINKFNTNHSTTLRPSHTSLHAYWNDPNFDTQSQISTCSSITKKRRAPRPPGYTSPNRVDPQIVYIAQQRPPIHSPSPPLRLDHHQSHESLQSENTKKKRKAPVVQGKIEQQDLTNHITRPGLEPPPPPSQTQPTALPTIVDSPVNDNLKEDVILSPPNDRRTEIPTPLNTKLVIITNPPELNNNDNHISETIHLTPPVSERKEKESEQKVTPTKNETVVEPPPPIVVSPVPKPPRQNLLKEKKSSAVDGLVRIISDHSKRTNNLENNEKQTNENISYFRVAKSRCGKFETDSQGFVNNSIAIFDSTNKQKLDQQPAKPSRPSSIYSQIPTNSTQEKSVLHNTQPPSKGKQAYNLLKKYEKEEEEQLQAPTNPNPFKKHNGKEDEGLQASDNPNPFKKINEKEKSPSPPIQLEVTERTTHITVTVESDRKQVITKTSPVLQQIPVPPPPPPPPPPMVAPKPYGKTITEYRTIRRICNGEDQTTTMRNNAGQSNNTDKRLSRNSVASHEDLMESIRRFGGSQNLGKK